jgi:hypothetical protein
MSVNTGRQNGYDGLNPLQKKLHIFNSEKNIILSKYIMLFPLFYKELATL